MLALIGGAAIVVLVALIILDLCSPIVALILVPVAAALLAGAGPAIPNAAVSGVSAIAPVVAMFVFAILYFGVMTDAGLLDPVIRVVLRLAGDSPVRVVLATALLALLVHLDGSGAVCFMVVIPTMSPLYDAAGIDRRILACAASMAAGVNFLPWTGPTLRAAAALHVTPVAIFRPMLGVEIVGLAFVFAVAAWLGLRAGRVRGAETRATAVSYAIAETEEALRRPRLFWFNLVLTLGVMAALIGGLAPPAAVFMVGFVVALTINYPRPAQQRVRIEAHAKAALTMAGVLFAAGVFSGVMGGAGLLKAVAEAAAGHVPAAAGRHMPLALAVTAMPLSLMFDPDSFYLGVLPVLAGLYQKLGHPPIQMAQAALLGQMTTGFPISPLTPATFLVAGLSRVDLAAHQRFCAPFLFAASLMMALAAVLFGVLPL